MADPTTLKDLAHANLTAWQARTAAARADATAAQAAVSSAVTRLADATQALANARSDGQRIRTALAAVPTTADATPLLRQLDTATIAQRAAEAGILAQEQQLARARARLDRAALTLRSTETARLRAQAESNAADLEATRVAALVAALRQPPLDTLDQDASDLLGSTLTAAAQTAAQKDIPAPLLQRATERRDLARERIAGAAADRKSLADLIQAQVLATGNTEDRLLVPRTAYAAALGALESYVSGAKQRLDRAQGALTRLADPARKTLLTEPQKTRLNTPTPASLTTERETAAGHEKALDEAQWALEQAQRKRDLAQVKEAAGAGAPGALAAAEADLVTRAATKTAADTAYPPSERTLLSEWEAAIPDAIWADLADYLDARTSLTDLAGTPTGTLETTLGTAEETLVHDLVALGKEQAARDLYAAELAGRTAAAEFAAGAAGRIVFSALRGDA